jgi:hypothetical protein
MTDNGPIQWDGLEYIPPVALAAPPAERTNPAPTAPGSRAGSKR